MGNPVADLMLQEFKKRHETLEGLPDDSSKLSQSPLALDRRAREIKRIRKAPAVDREGEARADVERRKRMRDRRRASTILTSGLGAGDTARIGTSALLGG